MKKSWWLTKKILTGEKTIESRWYKNKYKPFDCIKPGENIYFKDSGEPVTIKAIVKNIEQFENLDENKINEILKKYSHADLWTTEIKQEILDYVQWKKYCIIVHLEKPKLIEPFEIDKTGYWAMAAWICVDDINKIKK